MYWDWDKIRAWMRLYYREILTVLGGIIGLTLLYDLLTGRMTGQGLRNLLVIVALGILAWMVLYAYLRRTRGPA